MSTYSFQNVSASISGTGGIFPLGYGSDNAEEGISYAMIEEKNTMLTGADGGVMHSMHAGRSGTVVVRLLKTSPVNALLNALYKAQISSPANWGKNVILIEDSIRGDVITCTKCAFKKSPDNVFAKNGNILEWAFDAGVIDVVLGNG